MACQLTTQELCLWLEWANAKLIALPGGRIGPRDYRVMWPDFGQELFQVLDFRTQNKLRAQAPTGIEIELMDVILPLPNLCSDQLARRTIHARSIIHPLNHRHLFPWSRIAKILDTKIATARYEYKKGLSEVVKKIPPEIVCQITSFVAEHPL